jgi:hypothetical protein
MLLNQHNEKLRQFRVFRLSDDFNSRHCLPSLKLEDIECRCLEPTSQWEYDQGYLDDSAVTFIGDLIRASAETLHSLTVGQELDILRSTHREPRSKWADRGEVLNALSFKNILLKLASLRIIGLGVSPEDSHYFSDSIELSCLRSLTLESCDGSAPLIRQLAATETTDGSAQLGHLNLREFTFRYEAPDQVLVTALEAFLGCTSPLVHLSVLLDNTNIMPTVNCFIARHGETLKSLVWEGRQQKSPGHSSISLGTIQDPISELSAIIAKCTELRELSVPWSWPDANVSKD